MLILAESDLFQPVYSICPNLSQKREEAEMKGQQKIYQELGISAESLGQTHKLCMDST